jgi:hypothetical protein
MNKKLIIVGLVVAVIFGAGGFFVGTKYQQTRRTAIFNQTGNRNGQGQVRGINFRPVNGEIINTDDKSITVKMQDGSSKIVLFSDQTQINQATTATKSDLKTGNTVAVFGTANSDGSVTAQSIQLNPQEFRGGENLPTPKP